MVVFLVEVFSHPAGDPGIWGLRKQGTMNIDPSIVGFSYNKDPNMVPRISETHPPPPPCNGLHLKPENEP